MLTTLLSAILLCAFLRVIHGKPIEASARQGGRLVAEIMRRLRAMLATLSAALDAPLIAHLPAQPTSAELAAGGVCPELLRLVSEMNCALSKLVHLRAAEQHSHNCAAASSRGVSPRSQEAPVDLVVMELLQNLTSRIASECSPCGSLRQVLAAFVKAHSVCLLRLERCLEDPRRLCGQCIEPAFTVETGNMF